MGIGRMTEADTIHVLKEMIHMRGTMKNWKAKKQIPRIVSIGVLLLCAAGSVAAQEQPAATEAAYDGTWESLQEMPVPAWFDDGKIGIFIHWGPYSVIGYRRGGSGYSEHVPNLSTVTPSIITPTSKSAGELTHQSLVTRTSFRNSKLRIGTLQHGPASSRRWGQHTWS